MSTQTGGEGETIQSQPEIITSTEELTQGVVPGQGQNEPTPEISMPQGAGVSQPTEGDQQIFDSEQPVPQEEMVEAPDLNVGGGNEPVKQTSPIDLVTSEEKPIEGLELKSATLPIYVVNNDGSEENVFAPSYETSIPLLTTPNLDLDGEDVPYMMEEEDDTVPDFKTYEDKLEYERQAEMSQFSSEVVEYFDDIDKKEKQKQEQIKSNNAILNGQPPKTTSYDKIASEVANAQYTDYEVDRVYDDMRYGPSANMQTFMNLFGLDANEITKIAEQTADQGALRKLESYSSLTEGYSLGVDYQTKLNTIISQGYSNDEDFSLLYAQGKALGGTVIKKGEKLNSQQISLLKEELKRTQERTNDIKSQIDNFQFDEKFDPKKVDAKDDAQRVDLYKKFENITNWKLKQIYSTKWRQSEGQNLYFHPAYNQYDYAQSNGPGTPAYLKSASDVQHIKSYAKWLDTEGRKLIEQDVKNGTSKFYEEEQRRYGGDRKSATGYVITNPLLYDIRNDMFEVAAHNHYEETGKIDNFTYSGFKATAKRLAKQNQVRVNSSIKETANIVLQNGKEQEEAWVTKNKKMLMQQVNSAKTKMDKALSENMQVALSQSPEATTLYNQYTEKISMTQDPAEKKKLTNEMTAALKKYPSVAKAFNDYETALTSFVNNAQSEYLNSYTKFKQDLYSTAIQDLQAGISKSIKDVYRSGINNDLNTYERANAIVNSAEFKKASFYSKREMIENAWKAEKSAITAMVKSGNMKYPKTDAERGKHWSEWTGTRPMTADEKTKWTKELAERTGGDARSRFIFYAVDDLLYNPKGKPTVYAIQAFAKEQLSELQAKKRSYGIKDYDEVIGGFNRGRYPISQEEAKQMLLTEEYLNKIINTPETNEGFWSELGNGFVDGFQIPFLGAIIGIQQKNTLSGAVDRYQRSGMDSYDISLVDAYAAMNQLAEIKPNSTAFNIGSGLAFTTSFMMEMAALGGFNALGRSMGVRVTDALLNVGKSSGDDVVRISTEAAINSPTAIDRTKNVVGFIAGGMTEGVVNPRAYEESIGRMIDNVSVQESGAYDGLIAIIDRNSGEGAFEAFSKGYANWMGMSTIERLGGHLPFSSMQKSAARYIGTSTFMKRSFAGKFMRDYGFKTVDEAADWLNTTGALWSGFLPEMTEEVIQSGWEALITGDSPVFGTDDQGNYNFLGMNKEEFVTTASVVAIFGGVMGVGRKMRVKASGQGDVSIETVDSNGVSSIVEMDQATWDKYNSMMSDENLTWKSVANIMTMDESLTPQQEAAIANVLIQTRGKEILEDETYEEWKNENMAILEKQKERDQEAKTKIEAAYNALSEEQKKELLESEAAANYEYMNVGGTMSAEDFARNPQANDKWNVMSMIYQNEQVLNNPDMTIETVDEEGNETVTDVTETSNKLADNKKKRKERDKKLTRGGSRAARQIAKQREEAEKKKQEEEAAKEQPVAETEEGLQFDMPKAEGTAEEEAKRTRKSSFQQPVDLTQTEQQDDTENIQGVSGQVGEGQEPIQTEPVAEAGQEEVGTSGVVQEEQVQTEEEIVPTEEQVTSTESGYSKENPKIVGNTSDAVELNQLTNNSFEEKISGLYIDKKGKNWEVSLPGSGEVRFKGSLKGAKEYLENYNLERGAVSLKETTPKTKKAKPVVTGETMPIDEIDNNISAINNRINEIYDNGQDDTKEGSAEITILNKRLDELEAMKRGQKPTPVAAKPVVETTTAVEQTDIFEEPVAAEEAVAEEEQVIKPSKKALDIARKSAQDKALTLKEQEYFMSNQKEMEEAFKVIDAEALSAEEEISAKQEVVSTPKKKEKPEQEQKSITKAEEKKKTEKKKAEPTKKKEAKEEKVEEPKIKTDSDGYVSAESAYRGTANKPEYDENGKLIPKGFFSFKVSEDGTKASIKSPIGQISHSVNITTNEDTGTRYVVAPNGTVVYIDRPVMTSKAVTAKKQETEEKAGTYKKRVTSFYDPGKKTPKASVSKRAAELEQELQYDPKSDEFAGTPQEAKINYTKTIQDAYDKMQITEEEYNALNDFLEQKKKDYYNNKATSQEEKKQKEAEAEARATINKIINDDATTPEQAELLQDPSTQMAVEVSNADTSEKSKKKPRKGPSLSATRRRGATTHLPETILTRLQKAFPNYIMGVETDQAAFQSVANALGRSVNSAAIIFDGVVYINDRVANVNTAMEEFAHLYLLVMEQKNNPLYKKGIKEVQEKAPEYIDEVMNDPGYEYIHENDTWENLTQNQKDKVAFEALSKMIADRGEAVIEEKNKKPIRSFIMDFWRNIGRILFGFSRKLDVVRDDIDTYTDLIARELLRGRPISTVTPERISDIMTAKEQGGRIGYVPLSASSLMNFKSGWQGIARRVFAANKGVGEDWAMKLKAPTRKVAAIDNQARLIVGELNQAIDDYVFVKGRDGVNVDRAKLKSDIDRALKDPEFRANQFIADPVLKQLIAPVVTKMRSVIDSLSKELEASGNFGESLVASINANNDMYVHTSYFIYSRSTDAVRENWMDYFSEQDQEEILDWIYNGAYTKAVDMNYKINPTTGAISISFVNSFGQVTTQERFFNDTDALKLFIKENVKSVVGGVPASIDSFVFNASEGTIALGGAMNIEGTRLNFAVDNNSLLSSINEMVNSNDRRRLTDFLNLQQQIVTSTETAITRKKQTRMNEAKKKFLMEIQDPAYNFANTVSKQASLLYKSDLEKELINTGYLAADVNPQGERKEGKSGIGESNWRKVTNPNSELYNKYIPVEVYDMLFGTDYINDKGGGKFGGVYGFALGASAITKMALTILSPGANAANYVSGWFQLAKTGSLPIHMINTGHKAALQAVQTELGTKEEVTSWAVNTLPTVIRTITNLTGESRKLANMDLPLSNVHKASFGVDTFDKLNASQKAKVLADELTEMGIINTGIESETLRNLAEYAFNDVDIPEPVIKQQISNLSKVRQVTKKGRRAVSRAGRSSLESFANTYQFSDSVFKAMMYLNHKEFNLKTYGEEMRRDGMSPSQINEAIKTKTAEQVRMQMPTYDRSPEFLRFLSRFPLVGPFVQFDFQNKVNDKNILLDGGRMMFSDAKRMFDKGMTKEAAQVFMKGAYKTGMAISSQYTSWVLYSLISSMYGWDDDDDETMRKVQPSYRNYNSLIHMDSNKTGVHEFIDINRVVPQALYVKYWRALTEDGIGAAVDQFFEPYTQEDVFMGALWQTFQGKNKYGQYDRYLDQLSITEKLNYMITERLLPSTAYGQYKKLIDALQGEESMEGVPMDFWNELVNMTVGVKIRSVRIDKQFAQRIKYSDFNEISVKKSELDKLIKERDYRVEQAERGVEAATDADIQAMNDDVKAEYDKYTEFVGEKMNELYELADRMRSLGYTDKDLYKAMNDLEVPKYFSNAIMNKLPIDFDIETGDRVVKKRGKSQFNSEFGKGFGGGFSSGGFGKGF